jgi:membrane protease YdiL (CAAX protease family)
MGNYRKFVVIRPIFGGGFLIWWTGKHHLSRWQFLGVFLFVPLPYTILENWAKKKVKLSCLRNSRKRLAESAR